MQYRIISNLNEPLGEYKKWKYIYTLEIKIHPRVTHLEMYLPRLESRVCIKSQPMDNIFKALTLFNVKRNTISPSKILPNSEFYLSNYPIPRTNSKKTSVM